MNMESQLVRSASGRIHERFRYHDRWLTDERCNLDDTEIEAIDEGTEIERSSLCGHCFPTPEDS